MDMKVGFSVILSRHSHMVGNKKNSQHKSPSSGFFFFDTASELPPKGQFSGTKVIPKVQVVQKVPQVSQLNMQSAFMVFFLY